MENQSNGTFSIRDASTKGQYTLTLRIDGTNKLIKIMVEKEKCGFTPDCLDFDSIADLVQFYRTCSLRDFNERLDTCLINPLISPKWQARQQQGIGDGGKSKSKMLDQGYRNNLLKCRLEGLHAEYDRVSRRYDQLFSQQSALADEHKRKQQTAKAYSDALKAMFGVCDRFNILRAAAKFTLHRSSHLFKARWLEQQRRMIRDCGLSVGAGELDADWDDLLNSVGEEDECTEPIHIWALAHICCRPIIVCPMDDPVDVDELLSPLGGNGAGIGRSASPRGVGQGGRMAGVESQNEEGNEGGGDGRRHQQHEEKAQPRQTNYHIYEGIFLPILWAPSAPISRSPLIISYRNGLFHAVAISDALYQRDAEVQRYVRIRRPLRRPGTAGDSLFRFLTRNELDNSALLAQFILFGHSTAQQLTSIRREPHSFLPETLHFYKNWMQAMLQLSGEGNGTCGTTSTNQLESRMDAIFIGNKKRKGGGGDSINSPSAALLQPHQQALMVQLFSPQITTQPGLTQQQQSEAGDETAAFGRWQQTDD